MDVEQLVWIAYLELQAELGRRLTRSQLRELSEHRQRLQSAALVAAHTDDLRNLAEGLPAFGE